MHFECVYIYLYVFTVCACICVCIYVFVYMYTRVCAYVELKLRIQELIFLLLKCPAEFPHPFLFDIDVFWSIPPKSSTFVLYILRVSEL